MSCVSANVSSTCVPGPVFPGGKQQWFSNQACASDPTTFGNSYFGSTTPQVLALVSGQNCSSPPTSGTHYPFASCIPNVGQVSTSDYLYNSVRVTEDVSTGTLYWAAFSDVACTSFAGFQTYGSVSSTNCVSSGTSVDVLNYQGLKLETVYTGSDCLSPGALTYAPASGKCSPAECSQSLRFLGSDLQYFSTQCTQEYDLPTASASFFQGKTYALFSHFTDTHCQVVSTFFSIEINQCFLSGYYIPGTKSGNLTYVNGSLTALVYEVPGCQGAPALTQIFAIDGSCSNQAKVQLHVAMLPVSNATVAPSTANVAAIVGGCVAGLVVILGVARVIVFYRTRLNESLKLADAASLQDVDSSVRVGTPDSSSSVATLTLNLDVDYPFITSKGSTNGKGLLFDVMTDVAQSVPRKMELSATPQDWSVEEAAYWCLQNGGTLEVVNYMRAQDINGRALLLLRIEEFPFATVGARVALQEALISLKEGVVLTTAAPPSYIG
ncbi:hypothetical protein HDU98_005019 [Podochytrium sp. JEL0797]|nr:hypothetical protein HDU98_005019 [Podochytrium sp. JEL0797]